MTNEQNSALLEAFNKVQNTQAAYIASKNRAEGMQAVLDGDPQKWSSTILNYGGVNYTRADLQTSQIEQAAVTANYLQALNSYQAAYNILKTTFEQLAAQELLQSQQNFNNQNPGVVADVKNKMISAATTQSTTKYLIIGAVALVIIVGILIIIRRTTKIA